MDLNHYFGALSFRSGPEAVKQFGDNSPPLLLPKEDWPTQPTAPLPRELWNAIFTKFNLAQSISAGMVCKVWLRDVWASKTSFVGFFEDESIDSTPIKIFRSIGRCTAIRDLTISAGALEAPLGAVRLETLVLNDLGSLKLESITINGNINTGSALTKLFGEYLNPEALTSIALPSNKTFGFPLDPNLANHLGRFTKVKTLNLSNPVTLAVIQDWTKSLTELETLTMPFDSLGPNPGQALSGFPKLKQFNTGTTSQWVKMIDQALQKDSTTALWGLLNQDIRVAKFLRMPHDNDNVPLLSHALHKAFEGRFSIAQTIPFLIQKGLDIDATSDLGATALHMAVKTDLESVKLLLSHGAKLSYRALNGYTALNFAVDRQDVAIIDYLLAQGIEDSLTVPAIFNAVAPSYVNPSMAILKKIAAKFPKSLTASARWTVKSARTNIQRTISKTPLLVAAAADNLPAVQFLLQHTLTAEGDKSINQPDEHGETPLHHICAFTNPPTNIILQMIARGADPIYANHSGIFPLMQLIARKANQEVIDAVLSAVKGPIPNGTIRSRSLLAVACESGTNFPLIQRMLPLLKPQDVTDEPIPALYSAAISGDSRLVTALLTLRSEPFQNKQEFMEALKVNASCPRNNAAALTGRRPLIGALMSTTAAPQVVTLVTLLLAAGATPNCHAQDGRMALIVALQSAASDILVPRLLSQKDESLNVDIGWIAPHFDVKIQMAGLVPSMSTEQTKRLKVSPLMVAAAYGDLASVHALIMAGANVNLSYEADEVFSPLCNAVGYINFSLIDGIKSPSYTMRWKVVQRLVEANADLLATTSDGKNQLLRAGLESLREDGRCDTSSKDHFAGVGFWRNVAELVIPKLTKKEEVDLEGLLVWAITICCSAKSIAHLVKLNPDLLDFITGLKVSAFHAVSYLAEVRYSAVNGTTPDFATHLTNVTVALVQASKHESLDLFDDSMLTPLFLAVASKKLSVIAALMNSGKCNPNTYVGPMPSSELPLILACESGSLLIIAQLLSGPRPADVNALGQTSFGLERVSPLHVSILKGNWRLANKLLDEGANPNVVSNKGISALSCACVRAPSHERRRLVKLLLKHGATTAGLVQEDVEFVDQVRSEPDLDLLVQTPVSGSGSLFSPASAESSPFSIGLSPAKAQPSSPATSAAATPTTPQTAFSFDPSAFGESFTKMLNLSSPPSAGPTSTTTATISAPASPFSFATAFGSSSSAAPSATPTPESARTLDFAKAFAQVANTPAGSVSPSQAFDADFALFTSSAPPPTNILADINTQLPYTILNAANALPDPTKSFRTAAKKKKHPH